ncbi:MAG: cyclase family protein, partial [Thermoanaerobaculia bacterium]
MVAWTRRGGHRWQGLILPGALLFLAACPKPEPPAGTATAPPEAAAPAPAIDLAHYRLVDLTYPFDERTLYWPTSPSTFRLERLAYGQTEGGFFYAANAFCTPEHGGTHLDAPIHFAEGRHTADQVPVEQLVAPAVMLDVQERTEADPDYQLALADVEAWEASHAPIAAGTIVLLRTGWGSRWPDRKLY